MQAIFLHVKEALSGLLNTNFPVNPETYKELDKLVEHIKSVQFALNIENEYPFEDFSRLMSFNPNTIISPEGPNESLLSHTISVRKHMELGKVKHLVKLGVNPNLEPFNGQILHDIICGGRDDTLEYLLENGFKFDKALDALPHPWIIKEMKESGTLLNQQYGKYLNK